MRLRVSQEVFPRIFLLFSFGFHCVFLRPFVSRALRRKIESREGHPRVETISRSERIITLINIGYVRIFLGKFQHVSWRFKLGQVKTNGKPFGNRVWNLIRCSLTNVSKTIRFNARNFVKIFFSIISQGNTIRKDGNKTWKIQLGQILI